MIKLSFGTYGYPIEPHGYLKGPPWGFFPCSMRSFEVSYVLNISWRWNNRSSTFDPKIEAEVKTSVHQITTLLTARCMGINVLIQGASTTESFSANITGDSCTSKTSKVTNGELIIV